MPRYICKLDGKYFEWSTVVDAVVTDLMTLKDFKEYYKDKYGSSSLPELEERLERVEFKGTSCQIVDSLDEIIPPEIQTQIFTAPS